LPTTFKAASAPGSSVPGRRPAISVEAGRRTTLPGLDHSSSFTGTGHASRSPIYSKKRALSNLFTIFIFRSGTPGAGVS